MRSAMTHWSNGSRLRCPRVRLVPSDPEVGRSFAIERPVPVADGNGRVEPEGLDRVPKGNGKGSSISRRRWRSCAAGFGIRCMRSPGGGGERPEDAEDPTQGLFAKLLERGGLVAADQEKGRRRTYLLRCLKYCMVQDWPHRSAREKGRGGGVGPVGGCGGGVEPLCEGGGECVGPAGRAVRPAVRTRCGERRRVPLDRLGMGGGWPDHPGAWREVCSALPDKEQACGHGAEEHPRSDVYPPGTALYRILTGHRLFPGKETEAASVDDVRHRVREMPRRAGPPWCRFEAGNCNGYFLACIIHETSQKPDEFVGFLGLNK
jgi:hypothetical protein